ncbi:MAG: hypothetical protein U1F54_05825 [Burkholderiales bacterium]
MIRRLLAVACTAAALCAQAAEAPPYEKLRGQWVRPDGGYVITVATVADDGKMTAMYNNPSPLTFSQAVAKRENGVLKAFFELRAGGYGGSTYTLTYDPATDRLAGVYYQAVAGQKFDVYFQRMQ